MSCRSSLRASSLRSCTSSNSSVEECFTTTQLDVLGRVEKITTLSNAHPFSQLQELQQARVIRSVEKEDLIAVSRKPRTEGLSINIHKVRVSANIGLYKAITFTGEGLTKKQAQKEAAETVFQTVVTYLRHSPPRELYDVVATTRKQAGPTKKELKEVELDQTHLFVLREIAAASSASGPGGRVGVLSIDLEQYECDLSVNLEAGVSFRILSSAAPTRAHHLIVSEHRDVVNGKFVDDHKWDFNFGESQLVSEKQLAQEVSSLLSDLCEGCEKVFLVGHTLISDLLWLDEMKVDRPRGLVECDIGRAYRALKTGGAYVNMIGMQKMLEDLKIEYSNLHNGGNDAYYNIEVLLKLMTMISK